jgi:Phage tail protein
VLRRLEVFSSNPSAPELPLGGFMPNDDPVQIRSIDGLGPVKAELASTAFASGRGELFQGSSIGKRNIVLNLGLNPNWAEQTLATLRQRLYGYFLPEAWTKLRFFSDHMVTVDIEGVVESFEPNIFSEDPEVQVSVLCHRPDFIDVDATIYEGVVDDGTAELEFFYAGTVNTGFEIRIDATAENTTYGGDFTIRNRAPEDNQDFVIQGVVVDGTKYFKLSTVRNFKRAQTISKVDGTPTNILSKVTPASVWPEIKPGMNLFSVAASEIGQAWTMAYYNRFGGL